MQMRRRVLFPGLCFVFPQPDRFTLVDILDSLVKIDDDRLQALLEEIQTMRKFQS
jgi:hypothetical protein